ncbi:MAG: phage tail domain-containing protein [bacterium]
MYENIIFNGIILTNILNVDIFTINTDQIADIVISEQKLARQTGSQIFNKEYGSKKITLEGQITAGSRNDYFIARNALIKATDPENKTLLLPMDGTPIQYTATLANIIFKDVGGGYAQFNLEFTATDPYGYAPIKTNLLLANANTASTKQYNFLEVIGGTVKTPFEITLHISVITGTTGNITFTNQAGETITVTKTWVAQDILTIDTLLHEVKVNGVLTDYTGLFFELTPDDTYITYTDTFTTRTVETTMKYRQRFL